MNKKRWIAVGIAAGLLLATSLVAVPDAKTELTSHMTDSQLSEVVINERDDNQKIALLQLDGTIGPTESAGLFGSEGYNHDFFMSQLKAIEGDETVKGVLLEVNTPGGGVYESAEIARELTKIQKDRKIPLYVSMKNMAASGGYYVSAKADKIFATEETMTGSIGVIMTGLNMSEFFDKIGFKDETVKSGQFKDIGSSTRKWTKEERDVLQKNIDSSYNRFVKLVAEGRGMSEEAVKKIADGRIYDGQQAKENGLVDELGYPDEALEALRKEHKLRDASVISYDNTNNSFAKSLGGNWLSSAINQLTGFKSQSPLNQSLMPKEEVSPLEMMYLYGGE
ncbi:signal peptide peptidase SppA [Vagococcus intermedius]|uniref:Signal peptide peptidase SppA n=1 Tax=Vagococcus intermedius TaxID=2991418 RepID=A0AAF0CVU7_9ENTE|nr:signal peptide peptidase SppA [Vagococcus intermedius]WEG73823.1 signal peptide peptidase SppA [Vagococcus intermedius]WEG75908.1 signal peptide peptidase SppA [Vagococcus intermedius]